MNGNNMLSMPRSFGANAAALLAMKAAVSALFQRRHGAREPARVLYYRAHSLLRTLHKHLDTMTPAA